MLGQMTHPQSHNLESLHPCDWQQSVYGDTDIPEDLWRLVFNAMSSFNRS